MSGEFVNRGNQRPRARLRKPRDRLRRSRIPARAARTPRASPSTSASRKASSATSPPSRPRCTARKTSSRGSPPSMRSSSATRATRRDKLAAPAFKYRVGKNVIEVGDDDLRRAAPSTIAVSGALAAPQAFALNPQLLKGATRQRRHDRRRSLDAARRQDATPRCKGNDRASAASAWRPAPSNYAYKRAPLVKAAVHRQAARRLQHRELLSAQGQLRPRPVVRGAGPRASRRTARWSSPRAAPASGAS